MDAGSLLEWRFGVGYRSFRGFFGKIGLGKPDLKHELLMTVCPIMRGCF